jgi:hypothetical protein
VARALARAEANMQPGSAAVDKAQGRNNRNISRASAEAGILQLSKPGSTEARKAKAAYDRLEKKIKKGEKTRTAAYNAEQRLGALKYAMTRGYGPTIAKAKVRAGGNRSLLEPAPGDRIKGGRQGGTIAKPRGMKPGALAAKRQKSAGKVDMKQAISRAKELRQQVSKLQAQGEALMGGGRRDGAIVNVRISSRSRRSAIDQGIRGSQLVARAATLNNRADRVLERAVASRKKAEREAAKPKRAPRSAESLRLSRAKQVEKRRSITTNPAGNRADSAGRMAANAARTQQRALAFYGGKAKKKAVAGKSAATSGLRPGELMNANARPVGTMAKPGKSSTGFKKTKRENLAIAESIIRSNGFTPYVDTRRSAKGVASSNPVRPGTVTLAKNSDYWSNPAKHSIEQRRQGFWSSSNPAAVIYHEIGHRRANRTGFINDSSKAWGIGVRPFSNNKNQALARRVGQYAATSPSEFVAEVYAGLKTGRRYDHQVMRAYREEAGFPLRAPARRRSRLRRPRKP